MKVFVYCAIYRPSETDRDNGMIEEIVEPLSCILAENEDEVRSYVKKYLDSSRTSHLDSIEVLVKEW